MSSTAGPEFTGRVLVLDDDPFILKLMQTMLERQGVAEISTCTNAADALARVADPLTCPSLIVLDLNMPTMDGIEFAKRLADAQFTGSVALFSGVAERLLEATEALLRARGLRVAGRLAKPASTEALAAVLAVWRLSSVPLPARKARAYSAQELTSAIDEGELILHYQPQVRMTDGHWIGVEALVRWAHPADGLVYPDSFIALAEEHGLIDALTQTVVDMALRQTGDWHGAHRAIKMSVNLSMDNLSELDFPDRVAAMAARASVDPSQIIFELTESRLMRDLATTLDILTRLRLKGFGLSIDDFGTGHSSLAQLRTYPFSEMKVDRSFVHGLTRFPTNRAIYDASLHLSSQLHLDLVAEGVEGADEWHLLRDTGCTAAQGYFIAKPMPAAELPAWHARWLERLRTGAGSLR